MCECIRLVNELHASKNTKLVTTIPWHLGDPVHILLMTEKVDNKKRQGPVKLLGAFCPFCGKAYDLPAQEVK